MKIIAASTILAAVALASAAVAQPTHVMVRAQALDAKFIGTHMGGVKIVLRDARTGAVLAQGLTSGGTGDTATIMKAPHVRGAPLAGGDAAGFDAVLDISRPTLVRAEASGPVGKPASAIEVTSTLWVLPGRDVGGDGWVLSFPGLVVEPTAQPVADGGLPITAKISPMCGCPIDPGGLWDAANYAVEAMLLKGDRIMARGPLSFAGQTGLFAGRLTAPPPGRYTLRITAADSKSPNAGVVDQPLEIPRGR